MMISWLTESQYPSKLSNEQLSDFIVIAFQFFFAEGNGI
jgi:hypothetical protein